MEINGNDYRPEENQHFDGSNNCSKGNSSDNEVFVNHGEKLWHEMRKKWVGDPSQKSERIPQEPIMSWTVTYEDFLSSTEPFEQQIPLAEMVDFLVDSWLEEGLYD